ncbi:MAG: family 78 glycoside hydrolase catalytic domain [Chitinophagaceae bacterium]|nr:family 78 glycoside hydrolase catalytic domain [Chitinophagaceae bacterium]
MRIAASLLFIKLTFCYALQAQPVSLQQASWISNTNPEPVIKRVAPVFRKQFDVNKQLSKAILQITALGLYEASINGKRIGNDYFTPGFTNYFKRLQYQEYDITQQLTARNEILVTVGEGWYRGSFKGVLGGSNKNIYGDRAGLLALLRLDFKDGSSALIPTDGSWDYSESNIRYSDLYDGELLDLGFDKQDWKKVEILEADKNRLVAAETAPVKKQEVLSAVRILTTPKGEQVADFGQNMAGWVQLKIKGKKGDTVRISHAEILDEAGNFYTQNLRTAKSQDIYVLTGGKDLLEPHFTYHGFRYAKIEGCTVRKDDIRAVSLYSEMPVTGTFSCSDPMLNRLQQNIEWSLRSNFLEIPTDCPQRSERLGWTGDLLVFAPTACYIRDTRSFLTKWLNDLVSEQALNGAVPNFIPTAGPFIEKRNGVAGWGDVATVLPWTLFRAYDDTALLKKQYPSMKAWVNYIDAAAVDGLWLQEGYGDWYAPGEKTDIGQIDQCLWYYSTTLLKKAAAVLGKKEDEQYCIEMQRKIRAGFNKAYLLGNGHLKSATQAGYVLALQFDLIPDTQRQQAVQHLVDLVRQNGNKLATGFLGTPWLLHVLSENGYTGLAYTLLQQKEYPSWLYPITKGATTIWEKWDAIKTDNTVQATSFNHYAYGAVGNWMYENIAGIKMMEPGYKVFAVAPKPGGSLQWAEGSYQCRYGKIRSAWKMKGRQMELTVEVPAGTKALVQLPGKEVQEAGPGLHRFTTMIH